MPKHGPSRPAIKRKPSIGEAKKKRKCGKCRKFGHYKSTCPLVNNSVVLSSRCQKSLFGIVLF